MGQGHLAGIIAGVIVALAGTFAPLSSHSSLAADREASLGGPEAELLELVNIERADVGLAALGYDASLALSASGYAAYMASARFFGHQGPDGSTLVTRDVAAGYDSWTWLGENLAAGEPDPRLVIAAWLASPEHRSRLLSTDAREIGIGFASGGERGYYWVVELGASSAGPSTTSTERSHSFQPPTADPSFEPPAIWTSSQTGLAVEGEWLAAFKRLGGLDTLGEPRSGVMGDVVIPGQTVQYFQRAVLEYHPENPAPYRIQRRLLGDLLLGANDDPASPANPPPGPATYLACSGEPQSGYFVADYTRAGVAVYFKDYFERHGGLDSFGCPKGDVTWRDGVWTQRFQAAVFEYHPENDRDGLIPGTDVPYRSYRVRLALLGDQYIERIGGLERATAR